MPRWISDEKGKWHPAKESVALTNYSNKSIKIEQTSDDGKKFVKTVLPGGQYIYEGPDRAAMYQWWEENGKPTAEDIKAMEPGSITFGEDFRTNSEFMEQYAKFRNMFGFNSVEEYLKYLGYDEKKGRERFIKNASVVALHELPDRVPEIKKVGGGDDRANPGKNIKLGGWGEPADMVGAKTS